MARINLLPWREQLREERKQRFLVTLAGVLIVAGGIVFLADQYLNAAIAQQNARNEFIRNEISALDSRIKEISELKTRRQQLVERMKIIQDLQGNRPIAARIFDQLVRTLPDGVYRYQKTRLPKDYLAKIPAENLQFKAIAAEDMPFEFMMNALRLNQGVAAEIYPARTGLPLSSLEPALTEMRAKQLMLAAPEQLACTEHGHLFLNSVLEEFL